MYVINFFLLVSEILILCVNLIFHLKVLVVQKVSVRTSLLLIPNHFLVSYQKDFSFSLPNFVYLELDHSPETNFLPLSECIFGKSRVFVWRFNLWLSNGLFLHTFLISNEVDSEVLSDKSTWSTALNWSFNSRYWERKLDSWVERKSSLDFFHKFVVQNIF